MNFKSFIDFENNKYGTIALILGIAALLFSCCFGGLYLGVPGIILGLISTNKIREKNKSATIGLIASGIALLISGAAAVSLSNSRSASPSVADTSSEIAENTSELIDSEEISTEEPQTTEDITDVPHRTEGLFGGEIIGISDKDISDLTINYYDQVRNDVTGNWRYCTTASNVNFEEYALSYYKQYYTSDQEVHAIINFSRNTTAQLNISGGMMYLTYYDYVDKEEHDAKKLFSGTHLIDYIIYLDNGDIEKLPTSSSDIATDYVAEVSTSAPEAPVSTETISQEPATQSQTEADTTPVTEAQTDAPTEAPTTEVPTEAPTEATTETTTSPGGGGGTGHAFEEVENFIPPAAGTTYVLNTSTYKFHSPGCDDIRKMNMGNRIDSTMTREEVVNAGYSPCGHCKP